MSAERENRKKRNERIQRGLVSLVMFSLVAGGVVTYSMYQQRKAAEAIMYENHQSPDSTPDGGTEPPETVQDAVFDADETFRYYMAAKEQWQPQADGSVLYNGKRYRRNTFVKAILAIGVDRSGELSEQNDTWTNGQSDAVMVIAQDTAHNHIRVLMLPRDAVTEMYMTDRYGENRALGYDHLSLSWAYGDGREGSAKNTVDAVQRMLCGLQIDHYAAIDMSALEEINDAVGGVTVTVPNDEVQKANPEWTKGSVITLRGKEAERFLRYRDKDVDNSPTYRMQQHRAYMLGFNDAIRRMSRQNSSIVTDLYDLTLSYMVTDLDKGEFLKLGMDALGTDGFVSEDIVSLPGVAIRADETYAWDRVFVDYYSAIPVILDLFYRETE